MRTPRRAHSWLTVAAVCFLLNALALTGVAQLRLTQTIHAATYMGRLVPRPREPQPRGPLGRGERQPR